MKKLLAFVLVLALGICPALAEERMITPEETLQRMAENPILNLFDLRAAEKFDEAHLPGSVNFPLDMLEASIQAILDDGFSYMEAEIIVYGDSAEDGNAAMAILNRLGFENVWNLGTIENWPGEMISTEAEMQEYMRLMDNLDTVDIYGNKIDDSLLAGYKLTMVNVWATYCNPCISEMPELAKLNRDWQEKGVQIIGLLSDAADNVLNPIASKVDLAKDIAEATGADYPHLMPSMELHQKVLSQVSAVPTTFFVDENGMMVGYAYMGSKDYAAWNQIIEETLALLP